MLRARCIAIPRRVHWFMPCRASRAQRWRNLADKLRTGGGSLPKERCGRSRAKLFVRSAIRGHWRKLIEGRWRKIAVIIAVHAGSWAGRPARPYVPLAAAMSRMQVVRERHESRRLEAGAATGNRLRLPYREWWHRRNQQ